MNGKLIVGMLLDSVMRFARLISRIDVNVTSISDGLSGVATRTQNSPPSLRN
jgi:hypothetical protein